MNTIDLYHAATRFWRSYLNQGPGQLTQEDIIEFRQARDTVALDPNSDLPALVAELNDLFTRCVERSEGLCFVTGEAGLIPRHDLHERVDFILGRLHSLHRDCGPSSSE